MQIYINVFRNMMFIAKELLKSNNKKNPKMYGNFLWEEISLFECWYLTKVTFIYLLKTLEKLTISGGTEIGKSVMNGLKRW